MFRSIKIAILSYIHFKGWCEKLHLKMEQISPEDSWKSGCPLVDRILLELFPPLIWKGSEEIFRELIRNDGENLRPGSIIKAKQK